MIGSRLAHYEITDRLGSGGMGDVYAAADLKLGRSVAIKFLPETFAHDGDRVARFQREARVLAALNHPNIATIHGFEESEGRSFLVMELVPGETLAERIARGPVPLKEALGLAIQIATALESAHEKAITHRDLKPANIKLTNEGTVKVLDFGLAKVSDSADSDSFSNSPTRSFAATQAGVILGTAAYMSPEQARGKPADKRADIWAFGVVLYELLTGQRLFDGEDTSEILAKVIRDEPDLMKIPAEVRPLLRRCLEKDPRKRQRDIGDVRIELEGILETASSAARVSSTPAPKTARSRPLSAAIAATLLFILGAAAGIALWRSAGFANHDGQGAANGVVRLSINLPQNFRPSWTEMTPDGSGLIVAGVSRRADGTEETRGRIYTRRFDAYEFKTLPGTEGATTFQTSPDGGWIVFAATVSEQSSQAQLKKVRTDGSTPPIVIADWEDRWGDPRFIWLEDGDLLVMDGNTKFFRIPSGGGSPKPSMPIDMGGASGLPRFTGQLPRDRGVFFEMETWGPRGYQSDTWLLDPKTGKARRLLEGAGSAAYAPSGHIVLTRGPSLMAASFDLDTLEIKGAVTPLIDGVRTVTGENGSFQLSGDGRLMYTPGGLLGTDRRLVIFDASGKATPFTEERREYVIWPSVSIDGRKVAVALPAPKGTYETWVTGLDRPGLKRVIALPNADGDSAVWSPDGQRLAFARMGRDKDDGIYVQDADGGGGAKAVLKVDSPETLLAPMAWTPDGSGLVVAKGMGDAGHLIVVNIPRNGELGTSRDFHPTSANESLARFSPDGRLVAFRSDASGKPEIYAASYSSGGIVGSPVAVSSGNDPIDTRLAWAGDSRRLFYSTGSGKLMSVTVETKPSLSASAPVVAHDLNRLRVNAASWDILPDGRLLAVQKGDGEYEVKEFNIVLNWFAELRQRMAQGTRR
jgi:serine/threonine-protein kinase